MYNFLLNLLQSQSQKSQTAHTHLIQRDLKTETLFMATLGNDAGIDAPGREEVEEVEGLVAVPTMPRPPTTSKKSAGFFSTLGTAIKTAPYRAATGTRACLVKKKSWSVGFYTALNALKGAAWAAPRSIKVGHLFCRNLSIYNIS